MCSGVHIRQRRSWRHHRVLRLRITIFHAVFQHRRLSFPALPGILLPCVDLPDAAQIDSIPATFLCQRLHFGHWVVSCFTKLSGRKFQVPKPSSKVPSRLYAKRYRPSPRSSADTPYCLYPQHPARQQCLHVAPSVRDDVDDHLFAAHAIDEAIRFEVYLAIFADTQCDEFFGVGAALA